MKNYTLILCALSIGLTGCQKTAPTAHENEPANIRCQSVPTVIDIRDNGKGRTLADAITLSNIALTPNMIGYGPSLAPKAEITILDGTMYLTEPQRSDPNSETTKTTTMPSTGQGATFIVYDSVDAWQEAGALATIDGLKTLSNNIGAIAVKLGCGDTAVFPYKVKGRAKTITWSITGEPKGMKGTLENVDVVIVGLYDNSGAPRNAIMSGLNIHPHVVIDNGKMSGHVNAVELDEGATLFVPQEASKK